MEYTILETHIIYKENEINTIYVLWDDSGMARATKSTRTPNSGYCHLKKNEVISPQLFQRIAGGGAYMNQEERNNVFGHIINWSN